MLELADEMSRIVAARMTMGIASVRKGAGGRQIACLGYPKSGTSWVAHILSEALDVPEPSFYRLPVLKGAVLHGHRFGGPGLPTIYVVRDFRDVMVSLYHHRCRRLSSPKNPRYRGSMEERYRQLPLPFHHENVGENIECFIELEIRDPRDSRLGWPDHVARALDQDTRRNFSIVRYEDLLIDPLKVLGGALQPVLDKALDHDRLESAVARNEFAALTGGRSAGDALDSSFYRSGTAGGWERVFDASATELVNAYAGPTLEKLGYDV